MIYGVILAGGIGNRMGNTEKPKQYLKIGDKPIIVHTAEKFYIYPQFDKVLILCPEQWVGYTQNLMEKYLGRTEKIVVLQGGETRNDTIMNAISYIEEIGSLNENTIIVTHDAVRPFVTHRIIKENIKFAQETGACDTVIPATDTIVESIDHEIISHIPERANMYQGQTPQSFKALKLKQLYKKMEEKQKAILTDAAKIFSLNGEKVHLVQGEVFNIKITYPYDLKVAEALIQGDK